MEIKIDIIKKEIIILKPISIGDFINFVKNIENYEEYSIKSDVNEFRINYPIYPTYPVYPTHQPPNIWCGTSTEKIDKYKGSIDNIS